MERLKFYIHTLGCPKNEVDSEIIRQRLKRAGYREVSSFYEADVILVNSCGFIRASKEETIETVFSFYRNKRRGQKIIMLGCLAQRYKGELEHILPEVDCFVGADAYSEIDRIMSEVAGNSIKARYIGGKASTSMIYSYTDRSYKRTGGLSTFVKIADGCSNSCSFCAIPRIKGPYLSRDIGDILKEIEGLIGAGYLEIGLVSQDLTAFGLDRGDRNALVDLLREIEGIRGNFWVRLYYLYPRRMDREVLKIIADSRHIVHYVDIPLQHISDRILRLMKRGHTSEFIKRLIGDIRRTIPDVIIRSAFITGFPSESEEDYEKLRHFLMEYKLDNVGFFEYSDEEGTEAYRLPDRIHHQTKKRRLRGLYELQEGISFEVNKKHIGKVYDVLVEEEEDRFYIGRYYGQAPEIDGNVFIKKDRKVKMGFARVRIDDVDSYDLFGTFV